MFEKLRSAIKTITTTASQRTLKEGDTIKILTEFELALIESDIAPVIAENLVKKVKETISGTKVDRSLDTESHLREHLKNVVKNVLNEASDLDFLKVINEKKKTGNLFSIVFLGINGTGKTTTISKIGKLLKDNDFSVVFAAADTHRAGAIEQLTEHAKRLSLKVVSQRYGADPSAVARDAILYAKSHKIDVVLIDTAGRMQTSKNLMDEMTKIIRVIEPDLKIFVGDALAGSDTVSQAKEFSEYTEFDAAILTKIDADAKGGAALSIISVTGKPIIFLGMGQEYENLIPFDVNNFVSSIFDMK
ncbi:MAG TPA: signal recognition particle-docking protein FtsY [Nitrososphaerales archaeon]|nr:signal recognition particle-docking protein FtsY [Nitrososphaerales archaeon]